MTGFFGALIIGLVVGFCFGVIVMALLSMAHQGDAYKASLTFPGPGVPGPKNRGPRVGGGLPDHRPVLPGPAQKRVVRSHRGQRHPRTRKSPPALRRSEEETARYFGEERSWNMVPDIPDKIIKGDLCKKWFSGYRCIAEKIWLTQPVMHPHQPAYHPRGCDL